MSRQAQCYLLRSPRLAKSQTRKWALGTFLRRAVLSCALAGALALAGRAAAGDVYEEVEPNAALPVAPPAAAQKAPGDDPEAAKQSCLDAFKRAQRLRKKGELLSARAELIVCGQPACPEVVSVKCVQWVEEVRAAVPTIIVSALDPKGRDITDAELGIDGEPIASSLDGRPIDVDPGPHALRLTWRGRTASQDIVAAQGAKNRVVQLRFEPPPPPPKRPPPPSFSLPALSWAGFALAGAGAIVGGVTGAVAIVRRNKLDCPNDVCNEYQRRELQAGQALAHTSTVSFAVAGAGLVAGTVGLFVIRKPKQAGVELLVGPGALVAKGSF